MHILLYLYTLWGYIQRYSERSAGISHCFFPNYKDFPLFFARLGDFPLFFAIFPIVISHISQSYFIFPIYIYIHIILIDSFFRRRILKKSLLLLQTLFFPPNYLISSSPYTAPPVHFIEYNHSSQYFQPRGQD